MNSKRFEYTHKDIPYLKKDIVFRSFFTILARIKLTDIQETIDNIVARQKAENAPVIEFKEAFSISST